MKQVAIPEERTLHDHGCENLKFFLYMFINDTVLSINPEVQVLLGAGLQTFSFFQKAPAQKY
jgi:hypothetical protein